MVHRRMHPQLLGLVDRGEQRRLAAADELDAVRAAPFGIADRRAALFCGADRQADLLEHRVDIELGANNLVARQPVLDRHLLLDRHFGRADIARGGDAMRQPELEHIVARHALPIAQRVQMDMRIDKTGQHIVTGKVIFLVAFGRPARLLDRAGCADAGDLHDPVVLDDDVDRSLCGRAGAVDIDRVAQHGARPGPLAQRPRRDGIGDLPLFRLAERLRRNAARQRERRQARQQNPTDPHVRSPVAGLARPVLITPRRSDPAAPGCASGCRGSRRQGPPRSTAQSAPASATAGWRADRGSQGSPEYPPDRAAGT